jgi:hypothetical protein
MPFMYNLNFPKVLPAYTQSRWGENFLFDMRVMSYNQEQTSQTNVLHVQLTII